MPTEPTTSTTDTDTDTDTDITEADITEAGTRTASNGIRDLADRMLADIRGELASAFAAINLAEQEIAAAQQRHPDAADRIWHGFTLLRPTYDLMINQAVYRAHCVELLDRVAAGADARPGTAAECCIALCETSQRAPLTYAAVGLYARMWQSAGLPDVDMTDPLVHYEALDGALIDDHERWLRGKLSEPWRVLPADAPALRSRPSA